MTPMLTVDERIDSFTRGTRSWPHPDTFRATPSSLAEAGFYWKPFSSSPDNVVCFLCGKSLDGWTEDDDPFEEHLSHSRNCCWAIVKSIYPVEDGLPFHWDDEENLPRGERMTKARLQTFGKWWPHERTKGWFGTTKRMANAGFIYAPTDDSDDNVQCPYCETALDGWEIEDDPVHEHQRRRPNCPFFATRAAAPTKASAAKAAKQKRKPQDVNGEESESDSNLTTHSTGRTKPETKKSAKSSRSQKSAASESASSRSSNATASQ
ncbi:inhibitor of apoptosis repeat-containing protein [Linnemannia elongata AG-77]|uniref:Inhibitor of apoptosis repeat-containing protein n=1 Tax=Linnemannia elongata AG-77 TaxID=1314771 RepID=A0A197JV97_9FUNG|nr:inhibitor of apoptosis repeat-containing protein [Linnemannia elongata AG-77]